MKNDELVKFISYTRFIREIFTAIYLFGFADFERQSLTTLFEGHYILAFVVVVEETNKQLNY